MKSNRAGRTSQRPRPVWVSVLVILMLAAAAAGPEFLGGRTARAGFTGGPSVRVLPPDQSLPFSRVVIRWVADFVGDGKVELFDNPDGTGTPIDAKVSLTPANDHTIEFSVGALVALDTTYYFKITHRDVNGALSDLTNPSPLPPLFTGAQSVGDVLVVADTDSAVISWDSNVIGTGRVEYGASAPGDLGAQSDAENTTAHSVEVTGLQPGTTYQFRVSNRHAFDGDALAEQAGTFTTPTPVTDAVLRQGRARPRVVSPDQVSTLIVKVLKNNRPLGGAPVRFEVLPGGRGGGTFDGAASAEVLSDAAGRASALFKGTRRGMVRVRVSSPAATNAVNIAVVVEGSLW